MKFASLCGLAALIAGVSFTATVSAQGDVRIRPLPLLVGKSVEQEIELTLDQKAKVTVLHTEYMEAVTKLRSDIIAGRDFSALSDAERAKWDESFTKINDNFEPKTKKLLKPVQLVRAQQIAYQVQGPLAFRNPDVIKALTITMEQLEKMKIVNNIHAEKTQALIAEGESRSAVFAKLRNEETADLATILTTEQADKWRALQGMPFDTSTIPNQRFFRHPWF